MIITYWWLFIPFIDAYDPPNKNGTITGFSKPLLLPPVAPGAPRNAAGRCARLATNCGEVGGSVESIDFYHRIDRIVPEI